MNPNQLGRSPFPAHASQWMLVGLRGGGVIPPTNVHLLNTLIAYWSLDEASGTRNDSFGTMSLSPAGAPVGVPGKIGNGCQLISANSQYLTHADTVLLQVTSDFTFSLWVRIDIPDPDSVILSKYTQDLGVDYVIDYASSIGFYFAVAGDNTNAAIAGTVATGVWTHVLAWYDHTTAKVYLRLNDTTTYPGPSASGALIQTAADFSIGRRNIPAPGYLDGTIDEVGFWKRLLTPVEMTALYNGGAGLAFSSFTA